MTSLIQWRYFTFFEKENLNTDEKTAPSFVNLIPSLDISACSSGRGHLVFGDKSGFVHLVDRTLDASSFRAYEGPISHIRQMLQSNMLITIGSDRVINSTPSSASSSTSSLERFGAYPVLKLWNLDKSDKNKNPLCQQMIKLHVLNEPAEVTAWDVLEDLSHVAVGLSSGAVILLRGDISKERYKGRSYNSSSVTTTVLSDLAHNGMITGISFGFGFAAGVSTSNTKLPSDDLTLYVATERNVCAFAIYPNKEVREFLDDQGCPLGCTCSSPGGDFVIARSEAVYLYSPDGRGACFIMDAEKTKLFWFRSYLGVIGKQSKRNATTGTDTVTTTLNIYDLKNKLVAYSLTLDVQYSFIAYEWGMLHIITSNNEMFRLIETDTTSKLEILFKKNLYSLAINLAVQQNASPDNIADIYRRFGDHLYDKSDYEGAMNQYICTVGHLEPSYVIRKFLDAQRLKCLTLYLQTLHQKNLATTEHTTLLLNCYTKNRDIANLEEFIKSESGVYFDMATAVKVCRSAGYYEHALYLAKKFEDHESYIQIQSEDLRNYAETLAYINNLSFADAEKWMKNYGTLLISNLPNESTDLLIRLCMGEFDKSNETSTDTVQKSQPEDFIHLFVKQTDHLVKFLSQMVSAFPQDSSETVWNTLLELYIQSAHNDPDNPASESALAVLANPDAQYNSDHTLILCRTWGFDRGLLYLYEKLGLFRDLLQFHMDKNDHAAVLTVCHQFGQQDTRLWSQSLLYFADKQQDCRVELSTILDKIREQKLLSPLQVIQILSKNALVTLDVIKDYLMTQIETDLALVKEDQELIQGYREEIEHLTQEIDEMQQEVRIFRTSKCSSCSGNLDLPVMHFLCKHSFHIRCLGENEKDCPICAPENQLIAEIIQNQEMNAEKHDLFFRQLEDSEDGFSVIAEYFGRNLFLNFTDY